MAFVFRIRASSINNELLFANGLNIYLYCFIITFVAPITIRNIVEPTVLHEKSFFIPFNPIFLFPFWAE